MACPCGQVVRSGSAIRARNWSLLYRSRFLRERSGSLKKAESRVIGGGVADHVIFAHIYIR